MEQDTSLDVSTAGPTAKHFNDITSNQSDGVNYTFSICYQNVKGLRTKFRSFYLSIYACPYDIIILFETWLNKSFFDQKLFNYDYVFYHCDRSNLSSNCSCSGRVLVAVSGCFFIFDACNIEAVFVKIISLQRSIFICGLYTPSWTDSLIW